MTPSPWTPKRIATLKRMRSEGYSASLIAMALGGGITRNAVIGKVHRLKLGSAKVTKPKTPAIKGLMGRPKQRARPKSAPRVVVPLRPDVALPSLNLLIWELTNHTCKWAYGERAPFLFCGHKNEPGKSFCPAHAGVSYREGTQRDFDRMAARVLGGNLQMSRAGVAA